MLRLSFLFKCYCIFNYVFCMFSWPHEHPLTPLDLFSLTGTEMEGVMEKPTWWLFGLEFWNIFCLDILLGSCTFWKVVVFWICDVRLNVYVWKWFHTIILILVLVLYLKFKPVLYWVLARVGLASRWYPMVRHREKWGCYSWCQSTRLEIYLGDILETLLLRIGIG